MILWEVREQTPGCFAELRISRNVEMLLEQQSSCRLMTFMLMHGSLRIRCKVQKSCQRNRCWEAVSNSISRL